MGQATGRSRGKALKWILIVAAVVFVVVMGVCCFGGRLATSLIGDEVRADLANNPVILEHIGALEDVEMDIMASGEAEGDETFVFDVRGTKGSGRLTADLLTVEDGEKVLSGVLVLPSGESYDLFPDGPPEVEDPDGSDD